MSVQFVIIGGSSDRYANETTIASDQIYIVTLDPANKAGVTMTNLTMPSVRLMGDCILTPDGKVFIANGAQVGASPAPTLKAPPLPALQPKTPNLNPKASTLPDPHRRSPPPSHTVT